jgi:hypothetical protein
MYVRVEGTKEVIRAFREIDKKLGTDFGNDLKRAAEPVVDSAKGKIGRYRGASLGTIRSRRRGGTVYVEQSKAKVTGQRGDFGALQMRKGLIPALDENEAQIYAAVTSTLDKYANSAGF